MSTTEEELNSFTRFAQQRLSSGKTAASIDELYDQWRNEHPSEEDALAVLASIKDMQQGETGREFDKFSQEFKSRNQLPEN